MSPKVDYRKNFVVVCHVITSDRFLVHKDDLKKIGTDQKVGVYEENPVGFMASNPVNHGHFQKWEDKGTYLHKFRVYKADWLRLAG